MIHVNFCIVEVYWCLFHIIFKYLGSLEGGGGGASVDKQKKHRLDSLSEIYSPRPLVLTSPSGSVKIKGHREYILTRESLL